MKERRPCFKSNSNSEIAVHAMNHVIERYGVIFHAWIIMPDHINWLIQPVKAIYSNVEFALKRRLTAFFKVIYDIHEGFSIWQDRFWEHTTRNEDEYAFYVDYINFNPVKHGYVKSPKLWKFSSFTSHVKSGYYEIDWKFDSDKVVEEDDYDA
jgi:putative transposase